jgi:CBS domain-containing protein
MEALERLSQNGAGRPPVVGEAGDLVGVGSSTDLLRALTVIPLGRRPQTPSFGGLMRPRHTLLRESGRVLSHLRGLCDEQRSPGCGGGA